MGALRHDAPPRYGERMRRRVPISEREIPALAENGEAPGTEEQGEQVGSEQSQPVVMPSLWDLLVAPTSGARNASPRLFAAASHSGHTPQQPHLWE